MVTVLKLKVFTNQEAYICNPYSPLYRGIYIGHVSLSANLPYLINIRTSEDRGVQQFGLHFRNLSLNFGDVIFYHQVSFCQLLFRVKFLSVLVTFVKGRKRLLRGGNVC